ncbi:hypothetical protein [Novosphingobium pokkalii]|uniref:Autotransporter domain-containing protein n=2 Tax=Novosphingobium pokkalii TaxID=1770194 RepID=A0ABV7V3M0_9SPHN|nr:hypothetical protein [Novosphingobium pokkalii]
MRATLGLAAWGCVVALGGGSPARAADDAAPAARQADPSAGGTVDQWMAGLSAGVTRPDGGAAAPFGEARLTRRLGRGYVRAAITAYRSATTSHSPYPPSTYHVASVAGGGTFDGWIVEGQATLGRQRQGSASHAPAFAQGRNAAGAAPATTLFGFAGSVGRTLPLHGGWFLTPTLAAGYVQSRLALNQSGATQAMPAWSGAAHLRLDRRIGGPFERSVGAFVSARWTSNAAVSLQPNGGTGGAGGEMPGGGGAGGAGPGPALVASRVPDGWVELGVVANIGLSRRMWLDTFVTRSLGQVAGQSTAVGLGLRRTF